MSFDERDTVRQELRIGATGAILYTLNDTALAATYEVYDDRGQLHQASADAVVSSVGDPARTRLTCAVSTPFDDAQNGAELRITIAGRDPIFWPFDVVARPFRSETVTLNDITRLRPGIAVTLEQQARQRDQTVEAYAITLGTIARQKLREFVHVELRKLFGGGESEAFWRGAAILDADALHNIEVHLAITQIYNARGDEPSKARAREAYSDALSAWNALTPIRLDLDGDGEVDVRFQGIGAQSWTARRLRG